MTVKDDFKCVGGGLEHIQMLRYEMQKLLRPFLGKSETVFCAKGVDTSCGSYHFGDIVASIKLFKG